MERDLQQGPPGERGQQTQPYSDSIWQQEGSSFSPESLPAEEAPKSQGQSQPGDEVDPALGRRSRQQPQQRSQYSARMDRFLNNGILIVGILLILVLVVAFLV